jgi:hypothetical protein
MWEIKTLNKSNKNGVEIITNILDKAAEKIIRV